MRRTTKRVLDEVDLHTIYYNVGNKTSQNFKKNMFVYNGNCFGYHGKCNGPCGSLLIICCLL